MLNFEINTDGFWGLIAKHPFVSLFLAVSCGMGIPLVILSLIDLQKIGENWIPFLIIALFVFGLAAMIVLVVANRGKRQGERIVNVMNFIADIVSSTMSLPNHKIADEIGDRYTDILIAIKSAIEATNPKTADPAQESQDPKVTLYVPDDHETCLIPVKSAGHANLTQVPYPQITAEKAQKHTVVYSWWHQIIQYENNVYQHANGEEPVKPLPPEKCYNSIVTVPITAGDTPVGILSVTGKQKNAFRDKNARKNVLMFANLIAPLVYFERYILPKLKEKEEKDHGSHV